MTVLQSFFAQYPGYGLVILECVLICLQCQLESAPISRLRRQYFNKAFFEAHFPKLQETCRAGYPEMGSGRFADKLSDEQWLAFNNAQRAHGNYLEQLPAILLLLLVNGLTVPRLAVPMGVVYMVGRHVYGEGYRNQGPVGRVAGSRLMYIAVLSLLAASVYSSWILAGGVAGLTKFVESYTSW